MTCSYYYRDPQSRVVYKDDTFSFGTRSVDTSLGVSDRPRLGYDFSFLVHQDKSPNPTTIVPLTPSSTSVEGPCATQLTQVLRTSFETDRAYVVVWHIRLAFDLGEVTDTLYEKDSFPSQAVWLTLLLHRKYELTFVGLKFYQTSLTVLHEVSMSGPEIYLTVPMACIPYDSKVKAKISAFPLDIALSRRLPVAKDEYGRTSISMTEHHSFSIHLMGPSAPVLSLISPKNLS